MSKRGRPSLFKREYVVQAEKLCSLGATDIELADFFGVNTATWVRWLSTHAELRAAVKTAKEQADQRVERSLYHRATGYTFESVKIFMPAGAKEPVYAPYREHIAPDPTACIFWLKNRKPAEWREGYTHKVEVDGGVSNLELARSMAFLLRQGASELSNSEQLPAIPVDRSLN